MALNSLVQARLFRTSSFRLTLLYAGLFTACVLILFGIVYWWAAGYFVKDEIDDIGEEYAAIQDEAALAGDARLPEIITAHARRHESDRAVYLLEDPSGSKIAGDIEARPPQEGPFALSAFVGGRMRHIPAHGYRLANGDYLLIGQDPQAPREMKELIAKAFGASLGVTLVLAVLGGLIISNSVLRRVEAVSLTSRGIIGGDLTRRVPLTGADDEFDHLATSVNAMLDRIEDLMRSMRQVSNDIAHDLRTPLSRLRQRLEQARDDHDIAAVHGALDAAVDQVDSILVTFGALLRIAQIEAGGQVSATAPVDLSQMLARIAEDFAPAAEDRGQTLEAEVEPDVRIAGDGELLKQMVVNLVDNAIRHSPEHSRIVLTARRSAGGPEITVSDSGPGIPAAEREKVLRPFYRLDASRSTDGSGLGLSLVAAIAKRHRAILRLADNAPGLVVSVAFPAAA